MESQETSVFHTKEAIFAKNSPKGIFRVQGKGIERNLLSGPKRQQATKFTSANYAKTITFGRKMSMDRLQENEGEPNDNVISGLK
jgi:hypothetical protein